MRVFMRNLVSAGKDDGRRSRIGISVQGVQDESSMEAYSVRLVEEGSW